MKLTHIKQQKRNEENVNLFLDNKFWVSISKDQMLSLKLHTGLEINEDLKVKIESESSKNKVLESIQNYFSYRPRSKYEIRQQIIYKKEFDEVLVDSILNELEEKKSFLLNDEKFAIWFIENRRSSGFHGKNKIKAELIKKGISSSVISKVFASFDFDDDQTKQKIEEFILKNKDKIKAKNEYEWIQKMTQKLIARGFGYEEVKSIVEKYKGSGS
jgi:regulatory protein